MRILVLLIIAYTLSGCSAMLLSGSAENQKADDCTESDKEAHKRGC